LYPEIKIKSQNPSIHLACEKGNWEVRIGNQFTKDDQAHFLQHILMI
jgi:hypothetical protein